MKMHQTAFIKISNDTFEILKSIYYSKLTNGMLI